MEAETGTAIATFILAIATFGLVIKTDQTLKEMHRQSEIQTKRKELQEQEEAYSKFLGIKASIGAVYQHQNIMTAKESVALYSGESRKEIADVWLLSTLQNSFEEKREFFRNNKEFWEALGLIIMRFENTQDLTDFINSVIKTQNEFRDNFINKIPPEGLTSEQLEAWVKQMNDDFCSFDKDKFNPLLSDILEYLKQDINKGRSKLNLMETTRAKSRWQFCK